MRIEEPMKRVVLAGCLVWLGCAAIVRAETDLRASRAVQAGLPLPPGVVALTSQATTVDVGATSLEVESFVTTMQGEPLIEYYQGALPNAGWRVEPLPWQTQHEQATKRLKKAVTEHRQAPEAAQSKLNQLSEEYAQTAHDVRRQIYATRGSEHVIVNLWPAEKGTIIFMNRWSGDRSWLEGLAANGRLGTAPAAPGSGGWLRDNVCCSGEEVPALSGSLLPMSVPRYPNAKAIARSEPAGGGRSTALLKTPDSAKAVADFYRNEMPATGWKLLNEESRGSEEGGETALLLTFQKPDRMCMLTIQGSSSSKPEQGETLVTVSTELRVPQPGGRP